MKRYGLVVVTAILLTAGAGAWWMTRGSTIDPKVLQMEEAGARLFSSSANLTDTQRRAAWTEFRQSMEQLTPEQQAQFRDRRRVEFQRRSEERLKAFFALSPADRIKELDQRINEMQARRQRWNRDNNNNRSASANSGRGGPNGANGRGGGPGGQAGQGGPGGRSGWTSTDRNERRQQYLNSTTPEYRAMRSEYSRLLQQRMQQRGARGFG